MSQRRLLATALACAIALAVAACSSAPPKGSGKSKRTVLVTEYDDARVGEEASRAVAAQIGLLEDPALDAYVSEIGRNLLRGIPRRPFAYQFAIVDQFEPNAFALPGGYVFLSRGLLALANSEDELANVIGHEITHAARRHAAAQQELARRQSPLLLGWMRAAHIASYGRDMEREADRGGQMLAAAAGYDPMAMSTFLQQMGQLERLRIGHKRLPSFLDTHPGSQERAASNAARAREIRWRRDASRGDTRTAYLRRVDGLALEERPEAGVFQGDAFLHPDLDFFVRFPPGWSTSNTARAVGAVEPRGDAVVYLTADQPSGDPREMAEAFLEKAREEQSVDVEESQPVKIGAYDAWRLRFRTGGRGGSVANLAVFVPYRGATWRITGMTRAGDLDRFQGRFLSTARSFRPIRDEERRSIHSTRLRLVTARPGEDVAALGRRTGNAWDASTTAVYNGVFANRVFEGGELVKIARVEPYVGGAPAR